MRVPCSNWPTHWPRNSGSRQPSPMSDSTRHRDQILLEGMSFYAYHGVNPEERTQGQWFVVDMKVEVELSKPGRSDRLEDTVNYTDLYHTVKAVVEGGDV